MNCYAYAFGDVALERSRSNTCPSSCYTHRTSDLYYAPMVKDIPCSYVMFVPAAFLTGLYPLFGVLPDTSSVLQLHGERATNTNTLLR